MFAGIVLFIAFSAGYVQGVALPAEIAVCPHLDANYAECVPKAIEDAVHYLGKGSDALNLPKFDPLVAKKIEIKGNGGKVDLNQEYFDLNIVKHTESSIKNVDIKIGKDECYIKLESDTPVAHMIGTYKIVGKMLLFNLNGHGNVNITLVNLNTKHHLECEIVEKDGEDYLTINKFNVNFNPQKLLFDMENLIDGNSELSSNVLQVMNDNDLEIFNELKHDYEASIGEMFRHVANMFFLAVPAKQLFPDWY